MKTTFYVFVLTLLMVSCSNNDDEQQNSNPTLDGSWSLVNVSGGFAGIDYDFEVGLITWVFNQGDLELTVTNTNTTNVIYDGLPSGVYDYEVLTPTGEDTSVIINTFNYTITTLSSSQLVLNEGIAFDGFLLTFSK